MKKVSLLQKRRRKAREHVALIEHEIGAIRKLAAKFNREIDRIDLLEGADREDLDISSLDLLADELRTWDEELGQK